MLIEIEQNKVKKILTKEYDSGTWILATDFYSYWTFSVLCAQAKSSERGFAPVYCSTIASRNGQNLIFSSGQLSQPVVTTMKVILYLF